MTLGDGRFLSFKQMEEVHDAYKIRLQKMEQARLQEERAMRGEERAKREKEEKARLGKILSDPVLLTQEIKELELRIMQAGRRGYDPSTVDVQNLTMLRNALPTFRQ